jgi:hypothetical protein
MCPYSGCWREVLFDVHKEGLRGSLMIKTCSIRRWLQQFTRKTIIISSPLCSTLMSLRISSCRQTEAAPSYRCSHLLAQQLSNLFAYHSCYDLDGIYSPGAFVIGGDPHIMWGLYNSSASSGFQDDTSESERRNDDSELTPVVARFFGFGLGLALAVWGASSRCRWSGWV